jgi:hypothetical protein
MAKMQNEPDSQEMRIYFQDVIRMVQSRFTVCSKGMKGVD